MDELDPKRSDQEAYRIGESLYGLSVYELDARLEAYADEIERLKVEREKKSMEKLAADRLFKKN